jgi:ribosomal protein L12E/L44/L45/RPP1/RPP2
MKFYLCVCVCCRQGAGETLAELFKTTPSLKDLSVSSSASASRRGASEQEEEERGRSEEERDSSAEEPARWHAAPWIVSRGETTHPQPLIRCCPYFLLWSAFVVIVIVICSTRLGSADLTDHRRRGGQVLPEGGGAASVHWPAQVSTAHAHAHDDDDEDEDEDEDDEEHVLSRAQCIELELSNVLVLVGRVVSSG